MLPLALRKHLTTQNNVLYYLMNPGDSEKARLPGFRVESGTMIPFNSHL